jgi:Ca2+-binding EF-hand superfamily protein
MHTPYYIRTILILSVLDFAILVITYAPNFGDGISGLRILRLIKLLRNASPEAMPQLTIVLKAFVDGIKSFRFIGAIWLLQIYLFGVAGTIIFGENNPENFGTLHEAMFTLFGIATLDNVEDVMYTNMYGCDVVGFVEGCVPTAFGALSFVFIAMYTTFSTLVLLSIFLGVIQTSMEQSNVDMKEFHQLHKKIRKIVRKLKKEHPNVPEYIAVVLEVFDFMDESGDSQLSVREIIDAIRAVSGANFNLDDAVFVFRQMDIDQNSIISQVEFVDFMCNANINELRDLKAQEATEFSTNLEQRMQKKMKEKKKKVDGPHKGLVAGAKSARI